MIKNNKVTDGKKKSKLKLVVIALVVICVAAGLGSGNKSTDSNASNASNTPAQAEQQDENVPAEYKTALSKASSYSSTMHMSKQAIYDQLTSSAGEKFTQEEADYAIANL